MKKLTTTDKFRNVFHVVLGFTMMYVFMNAPDVYTLPEFAKAIVCLFAGLLGGAVIGVGIEFFQNKALKQIFDDMDVLRTIIGGIIGSFTAGFYKDIMFIDNYMYYGCLILCALELVRIVIYKCLLIAKYK